MSRLNSARAQLLGRYVARLSVSADTLDAAAEALASQQPEAIAATRRLAHQLRGSGASYGFPEISALAQQVEEQSDALIAEDAARLSGLLRSLSAVPLATSQPGPKASPAPNERDER